MKKHDWVPLAKDAQMGDAWWCPNCSTGLLVVSGCRPPDSVFDSSVLGWTNSSSPAPDDCGLEFVRKVLES